MRRDRLGKQARYAGYAALWLLIVIVMTAAGNGAGNHRARTSVDRITVDIDSPEGALLTEQIVREWVETEEYSPVGKSLDSIDLAMLEERISSHKAVARAEVSLNCDGSVDIDIRQRRPLMRLMVDGYDLYVSDDGYIFDAPAASTAYVPVVTGDYRPLFTPRYSGYSSDIVRDSIAAIERRIDELEREKIPFYRALQQNARSRKQLSAQRAHKGWFTSDEEYAVRREQVELYKAQRREELAAEAKRLQTDIDGLSRNQEAEGKRQKKLKKIEEDFSKLCNFVDIIRRDDLWSSEIVQIVAHGGGDKALELEIIPRSGRYTILLGRADDIERKLADLDAFYRNALSNVGWDRYRSINVKYKGQIVCR